MKIGVRVHDFGKSNAETLAKQAKEVGFDGVQFVLNKAVEGETGLPGTLNKEKALEFQKAFKSEGLEIFMMGAYFNPVHSNKELVKTNIAKFKEHLLYLNDFDGHFVGSETGSFNDDKWTYNPLNRTEEAYAEVKRIFGELADYAKEVNFDKDFYVYVDSRYAFNDDAELEGKPSDNFILDERLHDRVHFVLTEEDEENKTFIIDALSRVYPSNNYVIVYEYVVSKAEYDEAVKFYDSMDYKHGRNGDEYEEYFDYSDDVSYKYYYID